MRKLICIVLISLTSLNSLAGDKYGDAERAEVGDVDEDKEEGFNWAYLVIIGGVIYWVWSGGWTKKDNEGN